MFRQQALRKGHLKPIKAKVGEFIGPPTASQSFIGPKFLAKGLDLFVNKSWGLCGYYGCVWWMTLDFRRNILPFAHI